MDSIVDSFFPFLDGIEKEVVDMEALMLSEDVTGGPTAVQPPPPPSDALPKSSLEKVKSYDTGDKLDSVDEKPSDALKTVERRTQFVLPTNWRIHARQIKRSLMALYHHFGVVFKRTPIAKTTSNVHRMARTRRLVTSLTRVLAHKSEVVAQLQKRMFTVGEGGIRHGDEHDQSVYVYLGDVQGVYLVLVWDLRLMLTTFLRPHPYPTAIISSLRARSEHVSAYLPISSARVSIPSAIRHRYRASHADGGFHGCPLGSDSHR